MLQPEKYIHIMVYFIICTYIYIYIPRVQRAVSPLCQGHFQQGWPRWQPELPRHRPPTPTVCPAYLVVHVAPAGD